MIINNDFYVCLNTSMLFNQVQNHQLVIKVPWKNVQLIPYMDISNSKGIEKEIDLIHVKLSPREF